MNNPEAWGRALGPVGICLAFALIVVALAFGSAVIALTGIPRWKIPGLAWVTAGVWRELHGLRGDLRAFQRGEQLPELPDLPDSTPAPVVRQRESAAPPPSRPSASSRRRKG